MRNTTRFKSALLHTGFVLAVLIGTSSCGDTPGPASTNAPEEKTADMKGASNDTNDINFVVKATGINLEEIKLGELAQGKGKMKDVKDLGKMMVAQHTKLLGSVTTLAAQKNITIPTMLSDNATADYKKLDQLSGDTFDSQYVNMMVGQLYITVTQANTLF